MFAEKESEPEMYYFEMQFGRDEVLSLTGRACP
jgi:hypothetical protein